MQTAYRLSLSAWLSGCICCPGAEMWYKFTPNKTGDYTIYTSGSLDTVGDLYNANGTHLDDSDDEGSGLNLRMVFRLTANQTYYIKITAYGSNTGYFNITVTDTVFIESVSITPSYITLNKGDTKKLSANITPTNATNQTLIWESMDPSVATVNLSTGIVTARGRGSTYVYASTQDGSGKSSCCEVIVNVPVESVTVDTATRIMHVGDTDWFTATVCPADANNKQVTWHSSNTAVASVNAESGYVIAKNTGRTTITASTQNGKRGICELTVESPIRVEGISFCCNTHSMEVGDHTYLSYNIYPSDAGNQTVTWCSSNTDVAEVNHITGEITAKKAGTTTITATTNDGGFVASCSLRVFIETVTIMKDDVYNSVFFHKSEKVWRCINHDMLFNEENMNNQTLLHRTRYNFLENYDEQNPVTIEPREKIFTHDELKLLYAIDPYGVAKYVCDSAPSGLSNTLEYKDEIFELLFRREPKYFARTIDGVWFETTYNDNTSVVVSESECVFGMHPLWDNCAIRELAEATLSVIDIALTLVGVSPAVPNFLKNNKTVKTVMKIFSFTFNTVTNGILSSSVSTFSDIAFEETALEWACNLVSIFDNIQQIVSSFSENQSYYPQVIEYCANDLGYKIYVELRNGQRHQIREISELLSDN